MSVSTDLVVPVEPLLPMEPEAARAAMAKFQALTAAMLDPAEDWQPISTRQGRSQFVKRSGWQKIATGYRLSCEILVEEVVERDEHGEPVRARAIVRATSLDDSRSWDGSGRCSTTERGFSKPEHDVTATAVTRATNRAISNLVGFGAVSAEEVDGTGAVVEAAPVLDRNGLIAVAQALGERWPEFDSFGFLNRLIERYPDGVPESAGAALRGWARFATHTPAAQGNEAQATAQSATAPQTTTRPEG